MVFETKAWVQALASLFDAGTKDEHGERNPNPNPNSNPNPNPNPNDPNHHPCTNPIPYPNPNLIPTPIPSLTLTPNLRSLSY